MQQTQSMKGEPPLKVQHALRSHCKVLMVRIRSWFQAANRPGRIMGFVLVLCIAPSAVQAKNGAGQPAAGRISTAEREAVKAPKSRGQNVRAKKAANYGASRLERGGHPALRTVSGHGRRSPTQPWKRVIALGPQPGRVQEIQRALAEGGFLREEPTGKWDAQTREAMKTYQKSNGFPITGLPDAKSLMKLGLGPHPLPPELDHSSGGSSGGL